MSKDLSIPASMLRAIAQVVDMGKASELGQAVQALLEHKPFGESSLDDKIVAEFEGFKFTEKNFRETIILGSQALKRHRNGGGWVPVEQNGPERSTISPMPFVAATAYIGPRARVTGCARVLGNVEVSGSAQVSGDASISGNAQISGNARVSGCASVGGNVEVSGSAQVSGNAWIADSAKVTGNAKIGGHVIVRDKACVSGDVEVSDQYAFTGSMVITSADDLRGMYPYISL